MWSLFRYLYRHHVFILFVLLETISFILIFSSGNFQRAAYINTSSHIVGSIYTKYSMVLSYFQLSATNKLLADENARLRQKLLNAMPNKYVADSLFLKETEEAVYYTSVPARVINNSVNRQHNYITLDKGARHGIRPDMGVITFNGIAGVVTHVSESYAVAISMLNRRWNVSAKLKRNNYFGSLSWDGKDYRYALLNEIPFHVDLAEGDTLVTSGFSSYFPEGLLLGVVESFEKEGGENFYRIRVKLSADFKSLTTVEIIDNRQGYEIRALEKLSSDGENLD